jgi:hypothetical protein
LSNSAALVTGLAATGCAPSREQTPPKSSSRELERTTLDALGDIVLPKAALGEAGVATVLDELTAWLAGFEPVAELDHPYLWTDEIAYGPPDPAPLWQSQLEALELEAHKRHGKRYPELDAAERRAILERQLPRAAGPELPYAGAAPHVAIGILAYFYRTSAAHDLGYRAAIEEQTCRGLDSGPDEPAPRGD